MIGLALSINYSYILRCERYSQIFPGYSGSYEVIEAIDIGLHKNQFNGFKYTDKANVETRYF